MEKISKIYKGKDLKLKILSMGTASVFVFNNSSVLSRGYSRELIFQNYNDLKSYSPKEVISLEVEPTPTDYSNYIIRDTFTVGGRTIIVVSERNEEENVICDNTLTDEEQQLCEDGITPDSYIQEPNYNLDFETVDQMIPFYAKVFELNEDVLSITMHEILDNNEYSWQYGNCINGIQYSSIEDAVSRIACDISYHPENYNLTEEDVRSLDGYELDYFLPEELIYKFCNVLGVNPNIALSIAYGESGRNLDSLNFQNNHNVGGIVGSNGYVSYRNEATGLYRFIIMLRDNYHVTTESGSEKINRMASNYCENPDHWISLVGGIYYELNTYGYDYSYNTYTYQDRDLVLCGQNSEEDISRVRS